MTAAAIAYNKSMSEKKIRNIEFYFDPSCPFCWITSRWLLQISTHRDIEITWRQFSLALKNDELERDVTAHSDAHRAGHRVHRVLRAAAERGASLIDLYTAFGIAYHVAGFGFGDEVIADVLQEKQLPPELLAAADDTSYDEFLHGELQSATEVAGENIGVPTIVFVNDDGTKRGYFGPVLNELPDIEESLQIWDGLEKLAGVNAFYELKRARPSGDPDVFSTAKY